MKDVDQGHSPPSGAAQGRDGLIARPDGNNVSLDHEGLNLAEAQLKFKDRSGLASPGIPARPGCHPRGTASSPSAGKELGDESLRIDGLLPAGHAGQRMRAEVVAANMANAETTRTESGGPYHRQHVVFAANQGDPGFLDPWTQHQEPAAGSRRIQRSTLPSSGRFRTGGARRAYRRGNRGSVAGAQALRSGAS